MVSDDENDDDDDEDDTEALLAELEQIKKERAEEMVRKVNFLLNNLVSWCIILHDLYFLYNVVRQK